MGTITLTGRWKLRQIRKGRVIHEDSGTNLVVQAGKDLVADIVQDSSPTRPSHMALGTGSTSPSESDTTLVTEINSSWARQATGAPARSTNELTYSVAFTNGDPGDHTIKEAGIFNSAVYDSGEMLARWLTQAFTMANGDTLDINWSLTFG